MINFSQFLFEMSIQDAKSVLGISGDFDDKELKTAFRRASSKNHPDKGGSTDAMQKVNQAYDLLKTNVGKRTEMDAYAERMKQWRDISMNVITDLQKNLNVKAYTDHFTKIFGEEFKVVVTKVYPDADEIKRIEGLPRDTAPHYAYYNMEWNNMDRTKVFDLGISVSIVNVYNQMGKGLPTKGTTYTMGVSTFAYINGRKVKITARDYDHTSKTKIFTTPELIFPKKKIDKKKQTKFKKSDMLAALKREIKAETSGDYFFIPMKGDEQFLSIYRTTMMRQGFWSINGLWVRKGKYSWTRDKSDKTNFMSLPESEETLNILRKVKGMDAKKALKFIEAEYKKLIS